MPNLFCRVCGRKLKNPLSIRLGIGPVCRGRHSKQGELDFMKDEVKDSQGEVDEIIHSGRRLEEIRDGYRGRV